MQYMFSESWQDRKVITGHKFHSIWLHFSWVTLAKISRSPYGQVNQLYSYNDVMKCFTKYCIRQTGVNSVSPFLRADFDWLNYDGDEKKYFSHLEKPEGERIPYKNYAERLSDYISKHAGDYSKEEISAMTGKSVPAINVVAVTGNISLEHVPKFYAEPMDEFDTRPYPDDALKDYVEWFVKNHD